MSSLAKTVLDVLHQLKHTLPVENQLLVEAEIAKLKQQLQEADEHQMEEANEHVAD